MIWSFERPVIIVGAARSGTTLLAKYLLGCHPDLVYWGEPNHVWKHGNAYRRSDVLRAEDATQRIKAYIHNRFKQYRVQNDGSRILEKSPQNTLRMSFVLEVFPNAQVVHLIRDGRDVVLSAAKEWKGEAGDALDSRSRREAVWPVRVWRTGAAMARLSERLRSVQDVVELPAYSVRVFEFVGRHVFGSSHIPWGPRLPGLRSIRRTYSLLETCAIQWDWSVRLARSACMQLPDEQYTEVRYEDIIENPKRTVSAICEFLQLSYTERFVHDLASKIECQRLPKWPAEMETKDIEKVESTVGSTLRELGYPVQL